MFSDYDCEPANPSSLKRFKLSPISRKISDSSLSDLADKESNEASPKREVAVDLHDEKRGNQSADCEVRNMEPVGPKPEDKPKDVRIDIEEIPESPQKTIETARNVPEEENDSPLLSRSASSSSLASSVEDPSHDVPYSSGPQEGAEFERDHIVSAETGPTELNSSVSSLKVPGTSEMKESDKQPRKAPNMLSGISKTFHQWRTKTKKKKNFNYEKYIIYLESILPTVGFSVGGVIIDWNGIYTFIVIMTFMVGVFAQEAFFGK